MSSGFYTGGTFGIPTPIGGLGGGVYVDTNGNYYPQLYYGTPLGGTSTGYSNDLENFLTGTAFSASMGEATTRYNFNVGTSPGTFEQPGGPLGVGVGTPGVGVTYGWGPYSVQGTVNALKGLADDAAQYAKDPAGYSRDTGGLPLELGGGKSS